MKTMIAASALAAALVGSAPATAQRGDFGGSADCKLRIDTSASNWVIQGYDPFGNNAPGATFDLVFSNDGQGKCEFDPVFLVDAEPFGLSNAGKQRRVPYTLQDQFSNSNATPTSGRTIQRATNRPVVVASGGQQLVRYQLAVNEDAIVSDGLFTQRVMVLAEGRQRSQTLAARPLVLGINVLPSAALGLSGAYRRNGSQAVVDLGELSEGVAQAPLQLRVASTRAYRLEFTSKNAGLLKLGDSGWSIPYQLGVGDSMLPLAGVARYSSTGTDPTRDSLPLRFAIGSVAGKRAGLYSDIITVSIAPK